MAGTKIGGIKAAATNKARYGEGFYRSIGAAGGKISRGGGFESNPELAREAGRIGGKLSSRNRLANLSSEDIKKELRKCIQGRVKRTNRDIAAQYRVSPDFVGKLKKEVLAEPPKKKITIEGWKLKYE